MEITQQQQHRRIHLDLIGVAATSLFMWALTSGGLAIAALSGLVLIALVFGFKRERHSLTQGQVVMTLTNWLIFATLIDVFYIAVRTS